MKPHDVSPTRPPPRRSKRLRPAMPVAVAVVLGTFVLVAVLSVLAVGAWTGYRNTADLLREKAILVVDAAVARLRLHLGAAEAQVSFVAESLATGEVRADDLDTFIALMGGALSATPQINALYFLDTEHRLAGTERDGSGIVPVFAGLALDPDIRAIVAESRAHTRPYWGEFLWRDTFKALHINLRAPVWRDGEFVGVVMALVSVPALSEMIGDLETSFGYNAFILVDQTRVLAHPQLQFGFPGLHRWRPLPTIAETGDPVLAEIWRGRRDGGGLGLRALVTGHRGHGVSLAGTDYVFFYDEVTGFGPRPWLVGTYQRAHGLTGEVDRLWWALLVGGLLIVGALATAGVMGWAIARPARRLAVAAAGLSRLHGDSAAPQPLKGSAFRELDDAVAGFNDLAESHERLRRHAPVGQVAALGTAGHPPGQAWQERRDITVLAATLEGFAAHAATQPEDAAAVAGRFQAALVDVAAASGGVVERHGLDGAVAWWHDAGQAVGVVPALLGHLRADAALLALRPALGLDSGTAVVGCIPAGDHLAFTVVGGPVQGAEAVRRHAETLSPTAFGGLPVLATGATVRAAGLNAVSVGHAPLPVHGRTVELFRLI